MKKLPGLLKPTLKYGAACCLAAGLWLGLAPVATAQQLPQLSLYGGNQLLFNPAVAGIEDYLSAKAGYRQQTQGIPNAPQTLQVNVHGALNQRELNKEDLGALPMRGASSIRFKTETIRKIRHGLGGYYMNDRLGQWERNSLVMNYAIHIPFAKTWYFSGGAGVGGSQVGLRSDWSGQRTDANLDPTLSARNRYLLDLNLGAMVYSDRAYIGLSAMQLAQNKLQYGDQSVNLPEAKLNVHYYLSAGYRLPISEELDLSPAVLGKFSKQTVAYDVQARIRFRQAFFAGVGYRGTVKTSEPYTSDAVTGVVGLSFNKQLDVSYAYDFTTSNLQVGSNGSHEITLGARLYNAKKANPRLW